MARNTRDHGGGLDAAIAQYGSTRDGWIDLSTGINPAPFPLPAFTATDWTALPDQAADAAACEAARDFWNVPKGADVLAVPGCSAPIAWIPSLLPKGRADIKGPTYNEHAAAFAYHGWDVIEDDPTAQARVIVHPNNPTGHFSPRPGLAKLTIIDESFCDVDPSQSHIDMATQRGTIILKSFGKFWGLAGLRLGFVIGDPDLVDGLRQRIGPWPVSGPALRVAKAALCDRAWADQTRARLFQDAKKLDTLLAKVQGQPMGDTPLFRTYQVADAAALQDQLAQHQIWTRIFPYSDRWIRLGLPNARGWARLEAAL